MESASEKSTKPTPPYIPFLTLKNFIESLNKTAVPAVVDRSVMQTLSGEMQNQLISAIKFLGLISANNDATESLRGLVKSFDTSTWGSELAKVLNSAYAPITHGIDLKSASSKQLEDRFKDHGGVEGQMLDKCVRFFLKAIQATGATVSPHFKDRKGISGKRNSSARDSKTKLPKGVDTESDPDKHDAPLQKGLINIPIYLPDKPLGHIVIPENLSDSDCEMIDSILRAYAKRRNVSEK